MPVEVEVGLADTSEHAEVTLDSILDSAIAQADDLDAKERMEKGEAEDNAPQLREDKAGRLHGKDGKFAPKTNSAAQAPDTGNAEAAKTVEAPQVIGTAAQPQSAEAPARWTPEQKAEFAKWPPEIQQRISDNYKEIQADYTRKTQEAAEIRRTAEPLLNAIQPFQSYLAQLAPVVGLQPPEMIRSLLQHEYGLRTGTPEQKYATFAQLANTYGIDLAALARGEISQPDPTITHLRQELSELAQWKAQFEQQTQLQQAEQTSLHIESFATAKDEAGRPRYPHFDRVRGVMAQSLMNGEAATLEEAYQKATAPILEAVAAELTARQSQVDSQRKDALAKADKAAPVRSSGSQPGGGTKGMDLDSILSAAIDRHG